MMNRGVLFRFPRELPPSSSDGLPPYPSSYIRDSPVEYIECGQFLRRHLPSLSEPIFDVATLPVKHFNRV